MPTIVLDEETHEYFVDGDPTPGPSKILKRFNISNFDSPWYTAEGRDLGIAYHLGCAILNRGRDLEWDTVDSRIKDQLLAYRDLKADMGFDVVLTEKVLYSRRWKFCGKPDLVLRSSDRYLLPDIKRGVAQAQTALQTAAYLILVAEHFNIPEPSIDRYALHNTGNGGPSFKPYESKDDIPVFKGLVNAYHWLTNNGLNKNGGK